MKELFNLMNVIVRTEFVNRSNNETLVWNMYNSKQIYNFSGGCAGHGEPFLQDPPMKTRLQNTKKIDCLDSRIAESAFLTEIN